MTRKSKPQRGRARNGYAVDEINSFLDQAKMVSNGARRRKTERQVKTILTWGFGLILIAGLAALIVFWLAPLGKTYYDQKIAPYLRNSPQQTTVPGACVNLSIINGQQLEYLPTIGQNYCTNPADQYIALMSRADLDNFANDIYNASPNKTLSLDQVKQAVQQSLQTGQINLGPAASAPTAQPTVAAPTPTPAPQLTPTPTLAVFPTPANRDQPLILQELASSMNRLKIPQMQGSAAEVKSGVWTLHYQNGGADDYYKLNLVNLQAELSYLPQPLVKCVNLNQYDTSSVLILGTTPIDSSIQVDYGNGNIIWITCR